MLALIRQNTFVKKVTILILVEGSLQSCNWGDTLDEIMSQSLF